MHTLKCKHPGCTKVIQNESLKSAEHGLNVHYHRIHKAKERAEDRELDGKPKKLSPKIGNHRTAEESVSITLAFCPCCGLNLQKVAMGIAQANAR